MKRQNRNRRKRAGSKSSHKTKQTNPFPASYYRNSSSAKKKRNNGRPTWIVAAAALAAISVLLTVIHFGAIKEVEVVGLDSSEQREAIEDRVHDQYRFLWQPYFNSPDLSEDVGQGRIGPVTFELLWLEQKLIVKAKPSEEEVSQDAILNWQSGETSYGVNSQGIVVDDSEQDSLLKVKDESNLDVETGDRVGPQSFIDFVMEIEASSLDVSQYRVIDTTRELYADIDDGYYIRFDTEGSPSIQLENANRVSSRADNIEEYIDVRIPFKAYYR